MPTATSSTFTRTPEVNRKWEYGDGHEFVDHEEQNELYCELLADQAYKHKGL